MSDQFGKCEICFRAGYCTISQCKEQELKEIDVINRVVNQSTITGKVDENSLKNLPELKNISPKDIKTTTKNNDQESAPAHCSKVAAVSFNKLQHIITHQTCTPE